MDREVVRRRVSGLGTLLRVVGVVAVIVVIAGIFLGWFDFSTNRDESSADSKLDMTMTVNKDEMKRDAKQLKDKLVGLKDAASTAAKIQTVEGKVMSVDRDAGTVVVQAEGSEKKTTLTVDKETEFKLGEGKSSLDRLQTGDKVVVTYIKEEDVRRAKKISLLENKPS